MAQLRRWGQFEQYEAASGLPSCYGLYLSGELGYAFEKMREVGMMRQMDFHSHTSQYGSLTRSARFGDLDLDSRMRAILRGIQDGTFAGEWSAAGSEGAEMLARVKALRDQLALTEWEE